MILILLLRFRVNNLGQDLKWIGNMILFFRMENHTIYILKNILLKIIQLLKSDQLQKSYKKTKMLNFFKFLVLIKIYLLLLITLIF